MTYTFKVVNAETGEETLIPFTPEQIAAREKEIAEHKAKVEAEAEAEAVKAAEKAALLAKLGITQDEALLLLS